VRAEALHPGLDVIVAYGELENGPVCCLGTIVGQAEAKQGEVWWVHVYAGASHCDPLPQMFRPAEILGLASYAISQSKSS
jgi:hypothetical protein